MAQICAIPCINARRSPPVLAGPSPRVAPQRAPAATHPNCSLYPPAAPRAARHSQAGARPTRRRSVQKRHQEDFSTRRRESVGPSPWNPHPLAYTGRSNRDLRGLHALVPRPDAPAPRGAVAPRPGDHHRHRGQLDEHEQLHPLRREPQPPVGDHQLLRGLGVPERPGLQPAARRHHRLRPGRAERLPIVATSRWPPPPPTAPRRSPAPDSPPSPPRRPPPIRTATAPRATSSSSSPPTPPSASRAAG